MSVALRFLLLLAAATTLAPAARAETLAYPYSSILYDVLANRVLKVACEPPAGSHMTCSMTEIDVEPGADAPVPLDSLPKDADCADLPSLAAMLVDGIAPPGADAEAFRERFTRQTAAEKSETLRLVDAFQAYCQKKEGSPERLAEVLRDRARRSCTLKLSTYRLDFEWQPGTGRWESQSEPAADDDCATITVGGFEQPPRARNAAPWNCRYSFRPGASPAPGAACAAPRTEHLYVAEPNDIYATCSYLRFQD